MGLFDIRLRTWFQSTRPVRDATADAYKRQRVIHVSIHASRTGRDGARLQSFESITVSIHASRTGRDGLVSGIGLMFYVSIHASRTGRDLKR